MWQKFGWKRRKRAADMKYNKRGQEAWWFSTTPPTLSTQYLHRIYTVSTQYLHSIYTLHYTHTASCNMDTTQLTHRRTDQILHTAISKHTPRWHPQCVIVGKFSSSTEAELARGGGPDNGSKLRDCSENRSCALQIFCTCRYTASIIVHLQICGKYSALVDVNIYCKYSVLVVDTLQIFCTYRYIAIFSLVDTWRI